MAEQRIVFRMPLPGWPRAVFASDYGFRGGKLMSEGAVILSADSHAALCLGIDVDAPELDAHLRLVLGNKGGDDPNLALFVNGVAAPLEEELQAPTSRSALIHGGIALLGSLFGFVASGLYWEKAREQGDLWALKMAVHMAGWHLLLTLTLLPASVWGQRLGIRAVQAASLVFFLIHVGIALANTGDAASTEGIAVLNATSGLAFLAAVIQGQRAHADMAPERGLGLH